MPCPRCQRDHPDDAKACSGCGVVFERYDPQALARRAARQFKQRSAEREATARARRNGGVLALVLAALTAVALSWAGAPVPQSYSPPVEGRFSGSAHEYSGPGAALVLAGNEEPVLPVGRIEADGRFAFELPATMTIPRIPIALAAEARHLAGEDPSIAARLEAELQARHSTREAAVRRLDAGVGWRSLEVEPADLNVGRYGLAYSLPAGAGDLFPSNSDQRGAFLTGDHRLVLVYADRAGRVKGVARARNARGAEVDNEWALELSPGWNLVLSEQVGGLGEFAFRTGPVPDDLQWYAIDPRTRVLSVR